MVFTSISNLKLTAGSSPNEFSNVIGYYLPGDGGGGDFFWDATSTDPEDGGTVFEVTGTPTGRWKRLFADTINVKWFGAKGDGSDDTVDFQNAIDYFSANSKKGEIIVDSVYTITNVIIGSERISLKGGGTINGSVTIGNGVARIYNITIDGLTFSGENSGIFFNYARRVNVINCVFNNANIGIGSLATCSGMHVNAQINISKNTFNNVNYAVSVRSAAEWDVNSDWIFEGNIVSKAFITSFYVPNGIDGLVFTNNVIFNSLTPEERANATNHIYIGNQSDWLVIAENNFFEAKRDSIQLRNCKNGNINNNNFAWTGQAGIFNVLRVNGTTSSETRFIKFNNNVCDGFSGDVVRTESAYNGVIDSIGNTIYYSDTLPNYYGTAGAMAARDHYIVTTAGFTTITENNAVYPAYKSNLKAVKNGTINYGHAIVRNSLDLNTYGQKVITIPLTSSVQLFRLFNSRGTQTNYTGSVKISARLGLPTSEYSAYYELNIFKGASALAGSVSELSKGGLVDGLSSNDPSFSFYVDNDYLYITTIDLANGTYFISTETSGDLILGENI